MNDELFIKSWEAAPAILRRAMKSFAKYPTERNECYAIGHLAALHETGVTDSETHGYFLALVGQLRTCATIQDLVNQARD